MEFNDIYDENRILTGRRHRRGTPWNAGEYGLVVCVWVYNDAGQLLLTRRAPEKSFAGTWENSGGAAQAGENSLTAIVRELKEETGICAGKEEFKLFDTDRDAHTHYDFYVLKKNISLDKISLQPGETDDVMWATFDKVHELIRQKKICKIIAGQFLRQEAALKQIAQD
ncbi:MAG: NUDIX domain-containing protein [Oscillospiraceae bacterium]|nr:NUDIX domain-containing protein [Oscillospiraceae bacterium]